MRGVFRNIAVEVAAHNDFFAARNRYIDLFLFGSGCLGSLICLTLCIFGFRNGLIRTLGRGNFGLLGFGILSHRH